jgi:2-amino-4-hydroxy-6-hydroxymethyldihydropteridine diphosphokinase
VDLQRAYVGLGGNLGDARVTLESAIEALGTIEGSQLIARSSLYRTAPIGYTAQPDFINAVAAIDTRLTAPDLLDALQTIEDRFGRKRSFLNAPRTLDLDLLIYGQQRHDSESLTVPHPRLHERAFVLVPLAEIAPELLLPRLGSVRELLAKLSSDAATQHIERLSS